MNAALVLPLGIIFSSLLPGLVIFFLDESRIRLRTALNLAGAVIKLVLVGVVLLEVYQGNRFELAFSVLPDIDFVLRIDPLAMLFVTLSAVLWLLTTIYAVAYLEGSPNRSRFFGFFSICVSATVGIALAGNLFTLLVFYELLTLSTYPLVVHRGTPQALRAGRVYLAYTLAGGAALLAGIVWLYVLAGPVEFARSGGALAHVGREHDAVLRAIFVLLVLGFGVKAALVPLHAWLPQAMIAPAPVSALLHAVAVVKAGAFGIIRTIYDVFGVELTFELGLMLPLTVLACVTIIYGSLQALRQQDLKRRLAYSTVSQLSYIVLGASLFGPLATIGGLVHLVHQGIMKITLFFCAGALAEVLGIHRIEEIDGVGRRMPWTMIAFSVAALGMMAAPPMVGFVSEWYLGVGALAAGQAWVVAVLIASSLLNAAYFLPIIHRAWFRPPHGSWAGREDRHGGSRFGLLFPPLVTAALTLVLGLAAGAVFSPLNWARFIAIQEYPAWTP